MSRIEEALEKAQLSRKTGSSHKTEKGPTSSPLKASFSPLPLFLDQLHTTNPLLVSASDPDSSAAEEYRKLKSSLVKITHSSGFRNTLMVTSSLSGEGKSIVALNLAISLAQEYDHTVLIVDADLRKPSLHRYLGVEPKLGLAQCVLEGAELSSALMKINGGKLTLLPAGKEMRNPGELFSSHRFKELVSEIKNRYPDRYIIIDTPPVLPFAETRSLSSIVDGVVFVVKEGFASLPDITEAVDALKESSLLGIIYNEASSESISGHYNNYYYNRSNG